MLLQVIIIIADINGLMETRHINIVNSLELHLFCIKPSYAVSYFAFEFFTSSPFY